MDDQSEREKSMAPLLAANDLIAYTAFADMLGVGRAKLDRIAATDPTFPKRERMGKPFFVHGPTAERWAKAYIEKKFGVGSDGAA